jgi:hypothetical protein
MGKNRRVHKYPSMPITFIKLPFQFIVITVMITWYPQVYAQTDTVDVSGMYSGGSEGDLNNAVKAAINAGTVSNTVFKLKQYDRYVINGTITVPAGEQLTIVAAEPGQTQETAPPQILWTASSSVTKNFLIAVYGDLIMKNIWVLFADAVGNQTGTPIVFDGDTTGLTGDALDYGTFENCIFDYMPCPVVTASGVICVRSKHFNGVFRNCYFRNCVDRHFMYYGRAVSFPFDVSGFHTDSIMFENCTFANIGYVYQQESKNYADNVSFNHCTFLNIVMFSLESGWWYRMSVTNSLWVNGYMYGDIPAYNRRSGDPEGGTLRIDHADSAGFGWIPPFTDQDRRILFTNSSYFIEDWLRAWMYNNPQSTDWRETGYPEGVPQPQPMLSPRTIVFFDSLLPGGGKAFPYMNRASLYDSTDPGIITAPTNIEALKSYLYYKWCCGNDTIWTYLPEWSLQQRWPLPENLAYVNPTLLTAGMGDFPLGDLYHWWNPAVRAGATDYYSAWLAQADQERAIINTWLETGSPASVQGLLSSAIPSSFTLSQNNPNPFNPITQIKYSIPARGHASLKVYNLLGQEVATLFAGIRQPGNYEATFNGKELASGVYFYQLQANNYVKTKKLILLK